ncbi:MAG: aminotransferase class V-fold PLP-dependent enzyme, partial [Methanobrevibacter sp.]|nr:aminotransferase class V-fold PLP-dependent enzyme [Methanobrevibacter sp.]
AVALENNCKKIEEHRNHLLYLEKILLDGLRQADLDFIRNGSENHVPGNISLSFKRSDGEMLLHRLDLKGICVSTGSACNSKETEISHVLRAMDVPYEYIRGTIRISLGKDNTVEEVQEIVAALKEILEK